MHSNVSDNVSVDGFKNTKPGRGHGHGVDHGRGCGGGQGGHHPRSKSSIWNPSLDRQGKLTLTHDTNQDSVRIWPNCYNCGKTNQFSHYCHPKQ